MGNSVGSVENGLHSMFFFNIAKGTCISIYKQWWIFRVTCDRQRIKKIAFYILKFAASVCIVSLELMHITSLTKQ